MSHIVLIEDNVNNAKIAQKLMVKAGFTVTVAEDGEMGLTAIFDEKPDLALVDLGLPDIDGQTVVALLRQHEDHAKMPLIAFTAYPEATAQEMAEAYGCDGVITKPINTRTFVSQVQAFIEKLAPVED